MMNELDSYASLRNIVRGIFRSALNARGLLPYQSFAYTYDEVEGGFSDGGFRQLCLLVALFVCATEAGLVLDYDDPFTHDVLSELREAVHEFEARKSENEPSVDDDLISDVKRVRDAYLTKFDPV
ncbi:hypothetical protein ACU4GI_06210 [Cupriavidus basilensis]|uniref:hypothetical protein n=1 Tax=Cupriavidus sp. TaxID=1873897 RepID=UPI003D0997E7